MNKLYITVGYIILILASISMLMPFAAMVVMSFLNDDLIFSMSTNISLQNVTLQNYKNIFTALPIAKYFLNSFVVAFLTTIGQVIISAMAGYAFARLNFKYKEPLFFLILITMMVPPQVNIIPLFFLMREFHLIDTYPALILPGLFGAFGVFMMRQYFLSLPKDLEDSAKIDGCNRFQTFFKIALPLGMPAIATLSIFTFVTSWNSFMWPLIVTNTDSMRTLPVALAIFKGSFREVTLWGELFACSVICTIPVIIIFLIGKKYFINDLLQGAVKE